MPSFAIRELSEVPARRTADPAALEQQRIYESFIRDVGPTNVGELELSDAEAPRSVRTRLTRTAKRIGAQLQV